ncbi:MAG: hypothetical protein DCC46_05780 [Armatimonadetes bacterium]|nr:MAG: hypothetical protein DCC46_05780 [Armatimonadota bacterium]
MRASKGISLSEVLIVVAIIVLLAALLLPVFLSAKAKSKEVPCISNLRQVHVALSLYAASNEERLPAVVDELLLSTPTLSVILQCPADGTMGANLVATGRLGLKISYFYMRKDAGFRQALSAADSNHGVAYCVMHGTRVETLGDFVPQRDTLGLVLRLRRDGSVQHAQVGRWCGPQTARGRIEGRQEWSLLSDTHCVEPYCDGLIAPCEL